ncbi:MAG: archaellin/type IV pilin N-terminal domain-containing protein [Candidatus Micrarchaeaceae archaeon]
MSTKSSLIRTGRKVRGISPIIATIILIVITVVAGGFIYAYVSGMLHSGSTTNVADIQDISIVPSGTTSGTLYVQIQNGGAVEIQNVTVVSFNGAGTLIKPMQSSISIAPGQSGYVSFQLSSTNGMPTSGFVAGQTYSVVLSVSFANNANQLITTTATVASGSTS